MFLLYFLVSLKYYEPLCVRIVKYIYMYSIIIKSIYYEDITTFL